MVVQFTWMVGGSPFRRGRMIGFMRGKAETRSGQGWKAGDRRNINIYLHNFIINLSIKSYLTRNRLHSYRDHGRT